MFIKSMLIIEAIGATIFKKYAFLHPKAHFEVFFPHPPKTTKKKVKNTFLLIFAMFK